MSEIYVDVFDPGLIVGCSEYSMRYRPELDLVLKDISLTIVCIFSMVYLT